MDRPDGDRKETVQVPYLGELSPGACEWIMEQVAEEMSHEPRIASPHIPIPRALTQGKSEIVRRVMADRGIEVSEASVERNEGIEADETG